jgi:hypothetical protein
MVGGFSFYDRSEVKDMLSYLKLVQNPHDSVALGRVVNSPPRGIGKTTMETIERIALTTGVSSWDAIERAAENQLLPARALAALGNFRKLIEDARAMLGPAFLEKLTEDIGGGSGLQASDVPTREAAVSSPGSADDTTFDFGFEDEAEPVIANDANTDFDTSFNFDFDFGPTEEISTIAPGNAADNHEMVAGDDEWFVHEDSLRRLDLLLANYNQRASEFGASIPQIERKFERDLWYRVRLVEANLTPKWDLLARVDFSDLGKNLSLFVSEPLPQSLDLSSRDCDHCGLDKQRKTVYYVHKDGQYRRVGSTCVEDYLGAAPKDLDYIGGLKAELYDTLQKAGRKTLPVMPKLTQLDASINPFAPIPLKQSASDAARARILAAQGGDHEKANEADARAFRKPGDPATLPELIKFLNDRSGYIRALEEEATPESFSRIENLKELANAAQDATSRGETLAEFLDHAALVSDADSYSAEARVTLMTLHAAKGLEFPLVFLAGMEEGLFPHSRTLTDPVQMEEERRLCYVGMTRAMDTLIMSRARYRRRYGNDSPESSMASRFLDEVPSKLIEDLSPKSYGSAYATAYPQRRGVGDEYSNDSGYDYADEDQSGGGGARSYASQRYGGGRPKPGSGPLDNTAAFFGKGGFSKTTAPFPGRPKLPVPEPTGKTGLGKGIRVRHPKYGEGIIFAREGDGEDAKLTVQFSSHGMKKLVEKFAQLERL